MILAQISSYALMATVVTLGISKAGAPQDAGRAFSWLLPLYLMCTSIVIFSAPCNDILVSKYSWFLIKVVLCAVACHVHHPNLQFGLAHLCVSLGVCAAYATFADIERIYGCRPFEFEFAFAGILGILTYVMLWKTLR